MFFKTIRFKIILWHIFLLAIALTVFGIVLYNIFSQGLYENTDNLLRLKAEGVADSINTYWEAERLEAIRDNRETDTFSKINNMNFVKIAQHLVEEDESEDLRLMNIMVQIFDNRGKNIASSKDMSYVITFPKEVFDSLVKGKSLTDDFSVEISKGKFLSLRVYAKPIFEDKKVAYIVQVARPLRPINLALNQLKFLLLTLLPLTVFITGIAGVFMAKIALRPVDNMTKEIHHITEEKLKSKINIPDTKDEIAKLGETFNDMLARLDKAFSFQQQFIQDISHELKTPLTIIKGQLEVTLKKIRSPKEYESILMDNLEEIDKISLIIEELLILAKFDSKEMALDIKSVNLTLLLEKILDNIKILADKKNIKIDFKRNGSVLLNADENHIKRVFLNIFDNAIKYTLQNGKIYVVLYKDHSFAKVKIEDTGIGIPANDLSNIFNRFYRVDKSRSSHGFGLGLSIAKSIIEAHKGKIEVQSEVGHGSTFTVNLPI